MTTLLEYLNPTALNLLEYIDLLNRYSGGPSWGLPGPLQKSEAVVTFGVITSEIAHGL